MNYRILSFLFISVFVFIIPFTVLAVDVDSEEPSSELTTLESSSEEVSESDDYES